MRKNIILLLAIIVTISFLVTGCGSAKKEIPETKKEESLAIAKRDPADIVTEYNQKINDNNIDAAYDLLANETKQKFSKKDFNKFQELYRQSWQSKEFKIEKVAEYKEKELDGINFKNVVEFNVTDKLKSLYDNKEDSVTYKRYIVNENGTWKLYRDNENPKQRIAEELLRLSYMYSQGKGGKAKDFNLSAQVLNEALKYDDSNPKIYYALGLTYEELRRYEEAINTMNICLQKSSDNKFQSNSYNILGTIYEDMNQKNKAIECYSKALELDSNNQYAKTNLQRLK